MPFGSNHSHDSDDLEHGRKHVQYRLQAVAVRIYCIHVKFIGVLKLDLYSPIFSRLRTIVAADFPISLALEKTGHIGLKSEHLRGHWGYAKRWGCTVLLAQQHGDQIFALDIPK
jgi:hypothetical protein